MRDPFECFVLLATCKQMGVAVGCRIESRGQHISLAPVSQTSGDEESCSHEKKCVDPFCEVDTMDRRRYTGSKTNFSHLQESVMPSNFRIAPRDTAVAFQASGGKICTKSTIISFFKSTNSMMDLSHVMSQPMALFTPNYPYPGITTRKRPQLRPRTKTASAPMASLKVAPGGEGTSLDSLLDKRQKLLLLRKSRQESRCKRRSSTMLIPSPRYPVITELDEEENDDETETEAQELTADDDNQQFGASPDMTPITTIPEASEEESTSDTTSSTTQSTKSKAKSVISRFNAWVRGHSFKKRKNDSDKENGQL